MSARISTEGFLADLGRAVEAMLRRPALVLLTLALLGGLIWVGTAGRAVGVAAAGIFVVLAGFAGTTRVWFLRIFRSEPMPAGDVVRLTARFTPRFLLLGLEFAGVLAVAVAPAELSGGLGGGGSAAPHPPSTLFDVLALPVVLAADVFLTFVTPALALSTARVGEAYRTGWRMLRAGWPGTAWYALTPGLALSSFTLLFRGSIPGIRYGVEGLGWVFALACKGAAVAYYDRHCPGVGTGGAVAAPRDDGSVRVRSAFDPPTEDDGVRVLVDAVWPEGLDRERADLEGWFPELAPSPELAAWQARYPLHFPQFAAYYWAELAEPARAARLRELQAMAVEYVVTLLTADPHRDRSTAAALAAVLRQEPSTMAPQRGRDPK